MADRCEILQSHAAHVRQLADNMRPDDAAEAYCFGLVPKAALWRSYRGSIMCKTVMVDGEIGAMWGLGGELIGDIGMPWLVTSPAIERVPVFFVRQSQRELAAMLRVRRTLVNVVDDRYRRAHRFLEVLGFSVGQPEPFTGTGAMVRRFEMTRG